VTTRVHLDGLSDLLGALRELPDSTAKNVLRRVGRQALEPIAQRAKSLAPVEEGELRNSIGVSTQLSRRQRGMHQKLGPNDVEVFAGPGAVKQAHLMEFGTVDLPPQPYMRPAWDGGKDKLLQSVKELLWQEIQKAADRHARKAARLGL
jgi:HK97 gp10 family phage protein